MMPTIELKSKNSVRPDGNWPYLLECATREVFQIMLGSEIEPAPAGLEDAGGDLTAMVGLAGAACGVMSVRCRKETSRLIAARMLGLDKPPELSESFDALAEVCNMVAGNFKAKITGLADGCMLSVPTVVCGEDYQLFPMIQGEQIGIQMMLEGRPIEISLAVHQ